MQCVPTIWWIMAVITSEKIEQYLTKEHLSWVIFDSLAQPKIVSLISRLGIDYPGVRMTSLPHQKLAYDLASEMFDHPDIMNVAAKTLNEANFAVMEKVSLMSENDIRTLVSNPDKVFLFTKPGNFLWALVSDCRLIINELTPKFSANIEQAAEIEDRLSSEIDKEAKKMAAHLFSKKGYNKLLSNIAFLKDRISEEQKASGKLSQEIMHLRKKNIEQQKLIEQISRASGELSREKGVLNKQLERKQGEIDNLNQRCGELKKQLVVGPKMRLKSEIHRLEKENANLVHTLEKERQVNNDRINLLEKECLLLREELKRIEQVNLELRQQLDNEKQKFEVLERDYQITLAKKDSPLPVPKEKGRRLGIFIDNQNVYYSSKRQFGKKIDYPKLLGTLVKDRHLVRAICYIVQQPEVTQEGFINMLRNHGYTVRMRDLIRRADGSAKGNWDIGIAADVLTLVDKNNLDIVVLVTCDGDFVDLVKLLSSKGIRVEVAGFQMNMAMDLKRTADEYYFITEDLMVS